VSWYDSHCHLSEVAKLYDLPAYLKSAGERGIDGWLSCALSREEVRWHQLNRNDKIRFAVGIHPYYDSGTLLSLDELQNLAASKEVFALGEIGLDKRNMNLQKQITLFKDQLAIARSNNLPVVFHIVGHYDIFFKILSDLPVQGIWHGFNASRDLVRQFSKFGLTFSIGKALITSLKNEVINEIIKYGNYLIETDAPYNLQKPDNTAPDNLNPLIELVNYAKLIAKMNGVKLDSLQKDMTINAKQYFI
jgi:TatD DNase family protein